MLSEEKKQKKDSYFHLSQEDRTELELEDQEKQEKEMVAERVFEKLTKKK